jgi:hypothetical protein
MEDVHRFQAVNGDCRRSAPKPYGIGLIDPMEEPEWADIRGLDCSPEGTMPQKDMRGGGQVLENERGWCGMPECSYGKNLSDVDPQPGCEVGDVGAVGGGRGEEFSR